MIDEMKISISKIENGWETRVVVEDEDFLSDNNTLKTYYDMNLKDATQRARQLVETYFKD